jgi:hypothetical protein
MLTYVHNCVRYIAIANSAFFNSGSGINIYFSWRHKNPFNNCPLRFAKILLFFPRSYSYYIEVSMDQKDWVRVVDHTKHLCRSWQNLYFPPRVVRFIRIVGTHNTVNKVRNLNGCDPEQPFRNKRYPGCFCRQPFRVPVAIMRTEWAEDSF